MLIPLARPALFTIVARMSAAFAALALAACGGATESAKENDAALEAERLPIEVEGRRLFATCAVCHSAVDPAVRTPPRLVGPNLWGVVGRPAASTNFDYSEAMRASGVVWDEASLDAYLEHPAGFVRGNRMGFAGISDQQQRTAIIAYLKTLK
jgi:cytochrome c